MEVRITRPSSSLCIAIQNLVQSRLTTERLELFHLLGFTDFLAFETVAARQRAGGRIIVPLGVAESVIHLACKLGVPCRRASFNIVRAGSPVPGTDHRGRVVYDDRADTAAVIYFGVSTKIVEGAEQATVCGNHAIVGRIFGYPECCVKFFTRHQTAGQDLFAATIPGTGPFPSYMNPIIPYLFGPISLLFHFPCSPECVPSRELVLARGRSIDGMPPLLSELAGLAAGIALYGPKVGIGLISQYKEIAKDCFEVEEVATTDAQTRKLFGTRRQSIVRLASPHRFDIGDVKFDEQYQFAARFS